MKLRLSETISSASARAGQEIPFEVVEDIRVDDIVVLPKGATAIGAVTEANAKKSMGRGGKLNVSLSYARLKDQEKVALRATQENRGGGHVGAMTVAMVATGIVFFPVAPLFLFIHGKDITIPAGTEITAFVDGDVPLKISEFVTAPSPSGLAVPVSADQASLAIDSTPPGAGVLIDGAFVGNTPSTVVLAPGSHRIVIQRKGFADWSETLNVNGGSVRLDADLAPAPAGVPTDPPPASRPN